MSTLAVLLARLRTNLEEEVENEWSDVALYRYLNDARRYLASLLAGLDGSGWYSHSEEFTVAASTEQYDATGLTYSLLAIDSLWHVRSDGAVVSIDEIHDADRHKARHASVNSSVPDQSPVYYLARPQGDLLISFLPLATGVRTFRIDYRVDLADVTAGQESQTPSRYDDFVAMRAMQAALSDVQEADQDLEMRMGRREAEIIEFEAHAQSRSKPRRIRADTSSLLFSPSGAGHRYPGRR